MRARVFIEQEVDVVISIDDVIAEIQSRRTPESVREALNLLNSCIGAIKKMPTELISEMSEGQRDIVWKALSTESCRYIIPGKT